MASSVAAQRGRLQGLIDGLERTGARVGVAAVALPSGELLAEHRSREVFLPASNQKLLGLAATLHGLGAHHEFVTRFHVRGGALVIEACGDPNWTTEGAHDPRAIMREVATQLRARGIDAVQRVELLPGTLLGPNRPAGWLTYDQALSYCPPTGALVLDAGCFEALLTPARGADRAEIVIVAPPVTLVIDGAITLTADKKKGEVYGLSARDGSVRAYGALWQKAGARRVRGALPDGDVVAVRALHECLVHAGIEVRADATPSDADDVFAYRTKLLSALQPMLRESSNFHAEQLARALGAHKHGDGSCAGASQALGKELRALVGDWPDIVIDDAAGLSRKNRVSPAFLVTVLAACAAEPWGAVYADSLPSGGEGTLDKRFKDVDFGVRAKTGTLRDASALSGYVEPHSAVGQHNGGRIAFVVLVNVARGGRAAHAAWRDAQDRIVAAIAGL